MSSGTRYYILANMKRALYIALALLAVFAWRDWRTREIVHPPGVLVPEAPRQAMLDNGGVMEVDGYHLTRRARYGIRARVLSREDYHWGAESDLSPMDLALGWGPMSDQAVLDRIEITQGGRWYFTRYELPAPLPDGAIVRHSGNVHMIPANAGVAAALKRIRKGDIVDARGYLVDVDSDTGFRWRTSLRRDDTGGGSCELMYLESLQIEEGG